MNDDQIDREHRKKVENFRLNMEDKEPEADLYSVSEHAERHNPSVSSYSDPNRPQKLAERELARQELSQKAHQIRNREKRRKNRRFFRFIWLIMVLLVSLLAGQYLVTGVNDMLASGRGSTSVTVDIPNNAPRDQVASILGQAGVIQDVDFFRLFSRLTKAPAHFKGGSYQVKTDMDYEALLNSLQSSKNRVDTVKITFTEGENALEISQALEKNGVCSAKDAVAVINGDALDSDFEMLQEIKNGSQRYYKLEGYLFPDTYEFFKNEDPTQAIKKMVSDCNSKLTKQIREKAAEKDMTLDQTLTLASMIQAEAADQNDMLIVSSVFHNRLKSSKLALRRLSSDPTTYYPYRKLDAVPASIRSTYKSKYDTYTIEGLPPGPICSPGMEAIEAALNPSPTDYYYFCHDKNGKPYYAATSSQHQKNLKKAGLR